MGVSYSSQDIKLYPINQSVHYMGVFYSQFPAEMECTATQSINRTTVEALPLSYRFLQNWCLLTFLLGDSAGQLWMDWSDICLTSLNYSLLYTTPGGWHCHPVLRLATDPMHGKGLCRASPRGTRLCCPSIKHPAAKDVPLLIVILCIS